MFKKTKIAAAILATVAASTAQAVHVDNNGTGQVLLFPYYNTNANFQTSFNITNTTNKFKAVKIRLRESRDSNDVLDYNVYMSPWDQYTATIKLIGGKPSLTSTDTTCTFPSAPDAFAKGVSLRNAYADVTDGDLTEGYIEVIEMGDIADGTGPAFDLDKTAETGEDGGADGKANIVSNNTINTSVVAGLKHINGKPVDCTVVQRAWANGGANTSGFSQGTIATGVTSDIAPGDPYDAGGFNNGLVTPTGGLSGFSILLQTDTGAAFVADATAIDNYTISPQHFLSHDQIAYLLPSLASGDVQSSSLSPENGTSVPSPLNVAVWPLTRFDTGLVDHLSRNDTGFPQQVPSGSNPFPISAALAATGFSNDYFIASNLEGGTDWVVTLPMKKHGIFNGLTLAARLNPAGPACVPTLLTLSNGQSGDGIIGHTVNNAPASGTQCKTGPIPTGSTAAFVGYTGATAAAPQGEVTADFNHWDREETQASAPVSGSDFSPPQTGSVDTKVHFTREVNVTAFNNTSGNVESTLGTPAANLISYPTIQFDQGWGKIMFTSGYNLARHTQMEILVDGNDNTVSGINDATNSIDGVPSLMFAAIKAVVGGNKAGETVPGVRYVDINGVSL